MNLFSVFDPNAFLGFPLNWTAPVLLGVFVPCQFWASKTSYLKALNFSLLAIHSEFKLLFSKFPLSGLSYLGVALFIFILFNNFLGLIPYVFTSSSHLVFTLSLALTSWLGLFTLAWVKTPESSLAHLVPLGSPSSLSPFMVIIELVSAVIRPVTLSVRLAANMVAGHLLMTLISGPLCSCSWTLMPLVMSGLILLSILESAVAVIQAYVFSVLTCLYLNEVNQNKIDA